MTNFLQIVDETYVNSVESAVDRIFPVFFLSKPDRTGMPSDITKKVIGIFDDLADKYDVSVNVLTGEEGKVGYEETFKHCKIWTHSFNKLESGRHVTSMIRNKIIDIARESYDSDWIYMLDDDVWFTYQYDENDLEHSVETCGELYKVLKIWQYETFKCIIAHPDKRITLSAMPVVNKHMSNDILIDDIRVCQAVLMNIKNMADELVEYDESQRIWEDFDLLINCAYHKLSAIGIQWPIHFKEIRPMFSESSSVNYDVKKLNELSINLYKKWGSKIIPYFRPNSGFSDALNIKVGTCRDWIDSGCPIEVDSFILEDLDDLQMGKITFKDFSERHIVKNDYK